MQYKEIHRKFSINSQINSLQSRIKSVIIKKWKSKNKWMQLIEKHELKKTGIIL